MKTLQKIGSIVRGVAFGLAALSGVNAARAIPFASCITNASGTISFYLNEGGAFVTVTYDDGSTNTGYNGVTTGTNLPAGFQAGFSLTGHNSYSISVTKAGSGSPSQIATFSLINTRGVTANTIPTTAAFGRIYDVQANTGVYLLNSDLSLVKSTFQTGGIGFPFGNASTTTASPDWVSVAPDGSVLVTDESLGSTAVYQMAADFSSAQLFLGPLGTNGAAHGVIISPVILTGSIAGGNATLYTVDGDLGHPGSLQVYNINSGPLPWTTAPNLQGPQITYPSSEQALGGNEYVGFTMGPPPNNFIYASTYRSGAGLSANFVTITDSTGTNVLWDSENLYNPTNYGTPPTGDWFYQTATLAPNTSGPIGISGSAVSPDGKYLVGMSVNSYFVVAPLSNGIPVTSGIFEILPAGVSGTGAQNGRGVSWDAADNIIMSSSGLTAVRTYSLGLTATTVTTGNSNGTTGFTLTFPSTSVSVVAVTNLASQGGYDGTLGIPVPGTFSINRASTGGYASSLTVNYVLGGTAIIGANGDYTISGGTTNSATIPANQTNVLVLINPTTNNVPRPTNTVTLTIVAGTGYTLVAPVSDTVYIQNTSSQFIQIAVAAPTMYRAFSNDFASFTVTRTGDTGVYDTVNTFVVLGGTAVAGTDYTLPMTINFGPGDTVYTNMIMPLVGGQPPVDTNTPAYVGNLTAIIGLTAGSGYTAGTNTVTLTSIDNAYPPAPLLWSTHLTDTNESNSWIITAANGNMALDPTNYDVEFGYDLTSANPAYGGNGNGIIGYPPSGASNCLRITCNKDRSTNCNGGVNAFPVTGTNFGGNYAVRFYMNIVQGFDDTKATEGPLFGINHLSLGVTTNWFSGSGITAEPAGLTNWSDDGVWFWIDGQAGGDALGDYVQFTGITNTFPNIGASATTHGTTAAPFVNNFKYPVPFSTYPYYGLTGIPANESPNSIENLDSIPANVWCDVEVKQINNVVTMSIDKIPIIVYTNISGWTRGVPMLGYDDPYNSVQNPDSAAYFSDLRVVQILPPVITSIRTVPIAGGQNVVIRFTSSDGDDTPASFTMLTVSNAVPALLSNGAHHFTNVTQVVPGTNTFTQLGDGSFQWVAKMTNSSAEYYQIRHN